jgi:hypothetical protein
MASSLGADPFRNQASSQRYQTPHAAGSWVRRNAVPQYTEWFPRGPKAFQSKCDSDRLYLNKLLAAAGDASLAFLAYHFEEGPNSIQ